MQSQLFQSASDQWNSMNMTAIVVALSVAAVVLLRVWYWAKLALGSDTERSEAKPARGWVLRPSNFLFVVGLAGAVYIGLDQPMLGAHWSIRLPAGILVLAFVLRYWENKATAGFGAPPPRASRLDEFPGKDSGRD